MPTTLIRYQQRRNTATQWATVNEILLAGEPGYETDTSRWKIGDGTTVWSSLPYQGPLTVNAADPRFGNTRDQAQINAAKNYVKNLGGGKVLVRRVDGPWTIRRSVTGDQKKGGIYVDGSNITLESDGAVLALADNCDFITVQSTLAAQVTITADVAATDVTYTVTSSATFTVGQWVFVRLGQAAYDAAEPDFWLYAKVTAVPDATHVTLDRPAGYPMTVASVPTVSQRSIAPITTLVENVAIEGTWNLINPATGTANAETGVHIQYARNVRVGTINATTPGASALNAQFVDTGHADTVRVLTNTAQLGQASKGGVIAFAECRGFTVDNVDAEDFQRNAVTVEARSEGIRIESVTVRNTNTARTNANTALIAAFGNSKVDIGALHVTGNSSYVDDWTGTPGNHITIQDAAFYTSARPTFADVGIVKTRLYMEGKRFTERRRFTRTIPLTVNMSGHAATFPNGYLTTVAAYITAKTGVSNVYLTGGAGHSTSILAALTAGTTTYPSNAGVVAGTNHNDVTTKGLDVYTDATVPPGGSLILEGFYWADPAASDALLQYTVPAASTSSGGSGSAFTFRGAWAPSTVYAAADAVTYNGVVYTAKTGFTSGTTFTATAWNALSQPAPGSIVAGRRYITNGWTTTTTSTIGNGLLKLHPFVLPAPATITTIGVEVTAAGQTGAQVRLGIYSDASGVPGSLLLDAGPVAADAIASPEVTGLSLTLPAGPIWLGSVVQNAVTTQPAMRCATSAHQPPFPLSGGYNTVNGLAGNHYQAASTYPTGSLPSAAGSASNIATTHARVWIGA